MPYKIQYNLIFLEISNFNFIFHLKGQSFSHHINITIGISFIGSRNNNLSQRKGLFNPSLNDSHVIGWSLESMTQEYDHISFIIRIRQLIFNLIYLFTHQLLRIAYLIKQVFIYFLLATDYWIWLFLFFLLSDLFSYGNCLVCMRSIDQLLTELNITNHSSMRLTKNIIFILSLQFFCVY